MLNILEVCVPKLGFNLASSGPSNPMYWHLMVEAEEAGLRRPAGQERRPEVRDDPGRSSCSRSRTRRSLCGRIDPNARRQAGGRRRHRRRHDLPDDRGSLGQHGVARAQRVQRLRQPRHRRRRTASCCTTAARRSRSNPKSPNLVAPRKQPFHTIIAGFVMKDGQPLMTFGNMGGSVQPETHAQHMVNLIDHGMNVQMTTDAARFTHNQNSNVLSLEANLFNLVGAALKAKGHDVRERERRRGGRLPGHPLHARSAAAGADASTRRSVARRPAGQRRLPRRVGSPQGRAGRRVVGQRHGRRQRTETEDHQIRESVDSVIW